MAPRELAPNPLHQSGEIKLKESGKLQDGKRILKLNKNHVIKQKNPKNSMVSDGMSQVSLGTEQSVPKHPQNKLITLKNLDWHKSGSGSVK